VIWNHHSTNQPKIKTIQNTNSIIIYKYEWKALCKTVTNQNTLLLDSRQLFTVYHSRWWSVCSAWGSRALLVAEQVIDERAKSDETKCEKRNDSKKSPYCVVSSFVVHFLARNNPNNQSDDEKSRHFLSQDINNYQKRWCFWWSPNIYFWNQNIRGTLSYSNNYRSRNENIGRIFPLYFCLVTEVIRSDNLCQMEFTHEWDKKNVIEYWILTSLVYITVCASSGAGLEKKII